MFIDEKFLYDQTQGHRLFVEDRYPAVLFCLNHDRATALKVVALCWNFLLCVSIGLIDHSIDGFRVEELVAKMADHSDVTIMSGNLNSGVTRKLRAVDFKSINDILIPCNADGDADWGAVAVDAGATGGECSDTCVSGSDDATRIFAVRMECVISGIR